MADYIKVNTEWLNDCSRELKAVGDAIQSVQNTLSAIRLTKAEGGQLQVGMKLFLKSTGTAHSASNTSDNIRALASASQALFGRAYQLSAGASRAADRFEQAENKAEQLFRGITAGHHSEIYENSGSGASNRSSGGGSGDSYDRGLVTYLGFPPDPSKWTKEMKEQYQALLKEGQLFSDSEGDSVFRKDHLWIVTKKDGTVTVSEDGLRETKVKIYKEDGSYTEKNVELPLKGEHKFDDLKRKRPELFPKYDKDGNQKGYEGPGFDDVFHTGVEASSSHSWLHHEENRQDGLHTTSTTVDVGKVAWTAGIFGGLYSVKYTEDGKEVKTLSPGVKAEVGVSVSGIEVTHKGRYGNDFAGLDYGVSTKGLSASAQADGEIGIVDGHLAAHAGASAEVILGELSGEVGVDVAGVETKVKGTVNYGIGAHADIGIRDGKIKADVGVALGLGASVKVEIDYGKFVDNTVEKAKQLYKNAEGTIKAVKGLSKSLFGSIT